MATNPSNITIAQVARVWLAAVGTAAPADSTTAMGVGWRDVGLFTPDSLSWASDLTMEEVRSHQSNYPTRRFQTEESATIEVDLQEWSGANFIAVYGGGTVEEITPALTPPQFKFTPPAVGGRETVAAVVELIDGTKHYRRIVPRAQQVEGVAQTYQRTSESLLPLRLSVLGSDVAAPFYDVTDDPSFDPAP
jgi:hypothetical protein